MARLSIQSHQLTFMWEYDYDQGKGYYCEWRISHNMGIAPLGETLFIFNPSMAMGMNPYEYIDIKTLTHIDWGLDLDIPLTKHFVVTGMLHFTKSLSKYEDEDGYRIFEDIIPWAGLVLALEF